MIKKLLSLIFAVVGIAAALLAVKLSLSNRDADPVLLVPPEEATHQVAGLMDAVCQGDYAAASTYLQGQPELGVDREASDPVGVLIWNAFCDSVSYELVGECYATEEGLSQNLTISCMDITSVTANLKERSQALLEQRVEEAENFNDVYDDNLQYREDFVMDVLYDAATAALAEDATTITTDLTVNMVYQNETWWIIADRNLLDAISGGILY
ncbi:MAG: hypothetical protein IKT52_05655 [Oscillospiraceae bacterium]|nr:hypothetical protein [Oscillospiraceae bacterium]